MQQALPYKPHQPITTSNTSNINLVLKKMTNVHKIVTEGPIIVLGKTGCCLSHVVKRLLLELGVNPITYDIDEEVAVRMAHEFEMIGKGKGFQFPAVFIGGELFGGLDRVIASHITGELVPVLKLAGALWL